MSIRVGLARGLCLAVLLCGAGAFAQGVSVITGTVVSADDKRPLADVVVTATSPKLQGEQVVVSDTSGLYRLAQLPPGTYTLRVERDGYEPFVRGDIVLRVDRTIRVNIQLLPSNFGEEISISAAPPTVDVASSTQGMSVDADFLRNIAVIRPGTKGSASRSFESLAELAPGATEDRYGVSVSGSSSPESQYVVDGLSVNDPSVGTLGTPLSVEFVQEVNVITGGYMPEYGRSTGGVLNVVTKSGSNEFHGSVFANMAPGGLQRNGTVVRQEGTVISAQGQPWNQGDFGVELGGPILKDKLWFFVGVAPSFNRIRVDRQVSKLEFCTEVDPSIGCTAVGQRRRDPETGFGLVTPIDGTRVTRFADERSVQYLGKLTYLFNPDHNLSVSVFGTPRWSGGSGKYSFSDDGDPEVCVGLSCTGFVQGNYGAIATERANSAMDIVAKQSSAFFGKKLLIDATVGWHHQEDDTLPSDGSGILSGRGLSAEPNLAWRRTRNPGPHSITEFESLPDPSVCGATPAEQSRNCPVTSYATGGPGTISVQELDRVQGKVMATSLFQALGHHIVKVGFDAERMSFYNNRARTGGSPWQECTGGDCWYTLNEYGYMAGPDQPVFLRSKEGTSTSMTVGGFIQDSWSIMDKVTLNAGLRYDSQTLWGLDDKVGLHLPNQWSPRVGVVYDFTQQGRSKLFVNYARFFENVPLDMADLSFPQQQLLSATYNAPACNPSNRESRLTDCVGSANRVRIGSRESPDQTWNAQGGDRVPVDPDIRAQSADEFMVGGEYEVLLGRVGLTYTRRVLNDVIEDMSRDDGNTFFLGNPGKGYSADFPEAKREYDAVNVYYQKIFSDGWLGQASYTWSQLRGNYSGLFRADTGQLSPNLTRDFDLVSLTTNRDGALPGDRAHSFKVFGAREFMVSRSTSVNVGGGYRSRSGTPLNYLGAHPRRSGSETFILPRGSAGRLPWVHNIDTHVGLNQKLSNDYTLSVSLDVFNLFNFQQYTAVDQTLTFTRVYAIEQGGRPEDLTACLTANNPDCKVISTATNQPILPSDINPNFKRPTAYQAPRSVRLGAKLSF
ncbi:TonB-dependent receptor [Myxococcus stipitatus DSM 14675]|uniref:TonB-dependent receptor n=1 Tax=Myxococcus stipitatus (strain DSM 14675 / JCM 12634 / Mx s8) TaxID=1278073 RepID=L7ULH8_MYXSD|nr:TonB-dependent receptor [Myxococcus stipitatus DSM 14675]